MTRKKFHELNEPITYRERVRGRVNIERIIIEKYKNYVRKAIQEARFRYILSFLDSLDYYDPSKGIATAGIEITEKYK